MSGTTARRVSGVVAITIDGNPYNASDVEWSPSTVARETQIDQTAVVGYKEMPKQGFISATIRDAGSLTVAAFNAMTNSTIVIQQANGKTIYGSGMWTTEAQEVKTADGQFNCRWEGTSVAETLA